MIRIAIALVFAVGVGSASAAVRLFMTTSLTGTVGMTPAASFDGAERDFRPDVVGYYGGPAVVPEVVTDGVTAVTRTFYFWLRFEEEGYVVSVQGMQAAFALSGDLTIGSNVIYRHAKTNGPTAEQHDRWWSGNPIPLQNGSCLGDDGIGNTSNVPSYDIYDPTAHTALIGALEVTGTVGDVRFDFEPSSTPLFLRYGTTPPQEPVPLYFGLSQPWPQVTYDLLDRRVIRFVPEAASGVGLVVGALAYVRPRGR